MSEKGSHPMDATSLAVERTRLAHDRTLMAWVRTATALISFGFTIYKFFQFMIQEGQPMKVTERLGPRELGEMMIVLGLFSLTAGLVQYRKEMNALRKGHKKIPISLAEIVAGLLFVFGLLLFILAVLNR